MIDDGYVKMSDFLNDLEQTKTSNAMYEIGYKKGKADTLREVEEAMYHECFDVDHSEDGLQEWAGGNWFRYKLFENVMEKLKAGEQNG